MKLTFGSLFAGIGGLDLGLERAGMVCKWQVEIDDYATRVLERHWPDVRRWRDVTTFPPDAEVSRCDERPGLRENGKPSRRRESSGGNSEYYVDLICGGFPCQDISYAGRGAGLEGERSGLFFEAIRVVSELRPRYVLLENVAALLTRGLDRVHGELAQIGYCSESHCIPAAAVGAPHIRDRVFILAYSNSIYGGTSGTGKTQNGSTVAASSASKQRTVLADSNEPRLERGPIIGSNAREKLKTFERSHREPGGWWSVEPAVGRVANGVPSRVDRLRGLGNAVVPQVAEFIGRQIIEYERANHGDKTTERQVFGLGTKG